MKRFYQSTIGVIGAIVAWVALATPVWAHEGPDEGAEWLMADWMLLSFLIFFSVALLVFLVAVKRGYLRDLENAKYYILQIEEPDYYSPDWARSEQEPVPSAQSGGNHASA